MSSVDDVLATLKVLKKQLTSLRPAGDSVKNSEEAWVTLEQEAEIVFAEYQRLKGGNEGTTPRRAGRGRGSRGGRPGAGPRQQISTSEQVAEERTEELMRGLRMGTGESSQDILPGEWIEMLLRPSVSTSRARKEHAALIRLNRAYCGSEDDWVSMSILHVVCY